MSFSRKIIIVMFVLAMITCAPAKASTIEHCLRLKFYPPPPPPQAVLGHRSRFDLSRIVCRDVLRAVGHSIRSSGKLPWRYLGALCNIFEDNEQKIEGYIKDTYKARDLDRLIDGRSCAIIRKKLHPISPLSLPRQ
ncbi:hypothetical protein TSUD_136570 [Trifolium subterraneum]|uniref:Prolamin-like domain-containing protein n=1 Tax=Trifolium subterraneum TaxID=3900 RepID=A0A2Z6NUD2_TRISU|nr:hypothetical protein TSUD_136570 [Trifolium subterraneum]